MRELDRINIKPNAPAPAPEGPDSGEALLRLKTASVVGNGRAGNALASTLRRSGLEVIGPLARGQQIPGNVDFVLLCTPDSAIKDVALQVPEGPSIGHCCGAHGLELLPANRRTFCLHPLMTITESSSDKDLHGAWAAVDGSDPDAIELATSIAQACGMHPVRISSANRATYHAAASVASNFLIALESAAEEIASSAGLPREALLPLVKATVSNWSQLGSAQSLTGPVARGDSATVQRQRIAIEQSNAHLLPLFDALCQQTERVAKSRSLA